MSIGEFLAWLVGSGRHRLLCSQLIDWLRDHWLQFAELRPDLLRARRHSVSRRWLRRFWAPAPLGCLPAGL